MDDLTGRGKLAESKVVTQTYDDALSPALVESGQIFANAAKAFHLFLAPIQLLAVAQDRLAAFCQSIRDKVPTERQVEAPAHIAVPALLELRHMEDDNPITSLYINLLARAVDRDHQHEAHPAFVKLIGQLSPDEAVILHHLRSTPINTVEYRRTEPPDMRLHTFAESDFPVAHLASAPELPMYLDHLEALNLISYAVGVPEPDKDQYPPIIGAIALTGNAQLTQFGELFVRVCEPEE